MNVGSLRRSAIDMTVLRSCERFCAFYFERMVLAPHIGMVCLADGLRLKEVAKWEVEGGLCPSVNWEKEAKLSMSVDEERRGKKLKNMGRIK